MSKTIRVGTFNVENLFLRYKLLDRMKGDRSGKKLSKKDFEEGGNILMLGVSIENLGPISKSARKLTAKTIKENDADILAVQEIENLQALKLFNRHFLRNLYPYQMLVDANDPRLIDVGILSKYPITSVASDQFHPPGSPVNQRTFSRDCLQADVDVDGTTITILVNHFKSKIGGGEEKRERQAKRVAEILKARFGKKLDGGHFIVAGDLNAGPDEPELKPLLNLPGVENVIDRIPNTDPDWGDRWTHYYKKGKSAEQLDYLILSPSLAKANPDVLPEIDRKGLGTDIDIYDGPRYSNLTGKQGASDHCPVIVSLEV